MKNANYIFSSVAVLFSMLNFEGILNVASLVIAVASSALSLAFTIVKIVKSNKSVEEKTEEIKDIFEEKGGKHG